jgi:ankyrin repeat protein
MPSTGHEAVTKQLLATRCNVDLQTKAGYTALQLAERQGHAAVARLIRNKKQETPLLGSRVIINGLVAKPELNGRTGMAVRFDDDTGRYSVELDDNSSLMFKPCNLLAARCNGDILEGIAFDHPKELLAARCNDDLQATEESTRI